MINKAYPKDKEPRTLASFAPDSFKRCATH